MKIRVGDIVAPSVTRTTPTLYSGSTIYQSGIVLSIDPIVVASKHGDMRWYNVDPEYLAVIGISTVKEMMRCIHRLHS